MSTSFAFISLLFCLVMAQAAGLDATHWSFRPLGQFEVPSAGTNRWARSPVDAFISARQEEKGLSPSPEASATKLVRRMYFDLVGLPPTPEQVETFRTEFSQDARSAVESLVDRLLASPQYGERWARHWLDLARYADSNGSESDDDRPTAYHYRDFLIRAFNKDLPFNTMLRWQLAGDEIEPDNPEAIAATGFIVAGTHIILDVPMEEEKVRTRYNELDDMISTTGSAMLGLTLACARCHDHKYDPIPTRDYYRMLSAFNAGGIAEVPLAPWREAKPYREAQTRWTAEMKHAKKQFDDFRNDARKANETAAYRAKVEHLSAGAEDKEALLAEPRTERRKELAKKFSKELKVEDQDIQALLSSEKREEWDRLSAGLKKVQSGQPKALPTAVAFADSGAEPKDNWLLGRGDFHSRKEPLELGFISVLTHGKTPGEYYQQAKACRVRDDSTQQRRALAEWITDLDHGAGNLAARVIVNRVWQHHFGEGLVRTVNDFGTRGQAPTHPELLEWLTQEFVKSGWKLKPLHRLIMTSAVYLQESGFDAGKAKVDPENRLLWRQNPRRIESEILRDSMLAVSGMLDAEMFGPAFKPPIPLEAMQARNVTNPYPKDAKDTPATRRRTVYMFHKRVVQYPLMQAFDAPDAQASCGRRENTTVAPQALALLNDHFVRLRAEDFARRVRAEAGRDPTAELGLIWKLALAREATPLELEAGESFLKRQKEGSLGLANLCQSVFALNEFVYID
jgi:hypothetical protein